MAGIPAELLAPPSGGVRPPVEPRAELAPLDELSWSDFERLCVALARGVGEPEHVQRYGGPGQNQQGIDVYSRMAGGRYRVYQCKRYQQLGAADLRRLVGTFLAGTWADRAEALVVCTSARAVRTERAEAIEEQARRLGARGMSLEIWDADELSRRLKELPVVVLDFFGRAWVERLCTVGLPESAVGRLDVDELQRLRSRLGRFYKELFSRHAGGLGSRRAVTLDVLRERRIAAAREAGEQAELDRRRAPAAGAMADDPVVQERLPLPVWLGRSRRALLLGGAGTGKSTALRSICLDLLSTSPTIEELAEWGGLLPLWVPFGTWAGRAADTSADASLAAAVHGFFASYDEPELGELAVSALGDERLVLLVDGLDESSDERAARRAADRLQQVVAMRDAPVVATGRPEALASLGSLGSAWERAEVAPLSDRQAREVLAVHGAPDADVETLLASLARQRGVHALSRVPLLLALLWRSWRPADPMPGNRPAALELVLSDLIHEHPRRRELAGGPPARPQRLSAGDVQTAVEELALSVQRHGAGPVPEHDARIAVADVLRARGFTAEEATADARELLSMASGSMGLVVEDEPGFVFAHRALQEHLAARALLRRDCDVRESIVAEHRATPAWRAVLLGVLCVLGEPAETSRLVEAIAAGAGRRQRWAIARLLAEAAVLAPAVPAALRRRLLDAAAAEIETGLHAGVRHEVLDALAEAIGSPRLEPITARMQRWLPGRLGWHFGVWDELVRWPAEHAHRRHVENVLFNGLQHDDDHNAREAAKALSRWSSDTVCERLAALLGSPIPAQQRTAALEAFSRKCPDDPRTERWMATARRSPHTALRLVAIDWRVRQSRHDRDDLGALLRLADDWTQVDPAWSSSIPTVLEAGWPDDPEVRGLALQTVDPAADRPMHITTATWLLLAGYRGDREVIAWITRELDSKHPFVTLDGLEVYRLLAARADSEPEVLEAVDRRLPTINTAFMPSIYGAALVTRSPAAMRRLLALLAEEDSGALGWVVRALQEGWPSDDEALSALRDLSRRPTAAWVADQLARYVDDEQRDGWLLGLLSDPDNPRPARAAVALTERDDASREAALQAALERQHDGGRRADDLRRVLIELYADLPTASASRTNSSITRTLGSPRSPGAHGDSPRSASRCSSGLAQSPRRCDGAWPSVCATAPASRCPRQRSCAAGSSKPARPREPPPEPPPHAAARPRTGRRWSSTQQRRFMLQRSVTRRSRRRWPCWSRRARPSALPPSAGAGATTTPSRSASTTRCTGTCRWRPCSRPVGKSWRR
jgi:NACHT domain/Restriction endonuclease